MEAMEAVLYNPTASGSTATTSNPDQTLNSTANTGNPLHTNNAATGAIADDTNNDIAPPSYSTNPNPLIPADILDHTPFPSHILIALTTFYNARYLLRHTSSFVPLLRRFISFIFTTAASPALCLYLLLEEPVPARIRMACLAACMALHAKVLIASFYAAWRGVLWIGLRGGDRAE